MVKISYHLAENRRQEPFVPENPLGFGSIPTDHIALADYTEGKGWHDFKIVPRGPVATAPGHDHYGTLFLDGFQVWPVLGESERERLLDPMYNPELTVFRLDEHLQRFQNSGKILRRPTPGIGDCTQIIYELLDIERNWFPRQKGASIYVRPSIRANEQTLNPTHAKEYQFEVILYASGPYYARDLEPISVLLTDVQPRAVPGGMAQAKAGLHYGNVSVVTTRAKELGCKDALFLDTDKEHITEAGTAHHGYIEQDGTVVLGKITREVLDSITARSLEELCIETGINVKRKTTPLWQFREMVDAGKVIAGFLCGTAAGVSVIGEYKMALGCKDLEELSVFQPDKTLRPSEGIVREEVKLLYNLLTAARHGAVEKWKHVVPRK